MIPTVAMSFQQLSAKVREVYLNTRAEIEGKDAEIAELKKVREQHVGFLEKAKGKVGSLHQTIEQKDAEIAALKANAPVAELEAKVASLLERDARVKLFVDKLMAGKDVAAARIAELELKNGELALQCAELESRSAGLGDQLSAVTADKANLEHQVQNLIDAVADLATHNEDLAADFDDMEQRASLAEDDNIELVASIEVLESIVTASEYDLDQWKAAQAHFAGRLAETEGYLHQADEMNAEKDAEIEELHGKAALVPVAAPEEEPEAPTGGPASKKRRRGDGSLRREFTYDHVSVAGGKLMFKIADAEHPATDAQLRYVDVITAAGRSYNRYYVVRDGKEKMCRSKADVERAFGLTPTRKYSRGCATA
jgi:chromosome segregation ATPase